MERAGRKDWTTGNRAYLDLAVAAAGALLVALGLFMAVQDYAHEFESAAALRTVGETRPFDPSHRLQHVPVLLGVVVFVSVAVVWRAVRVRQSPRLRRHAARPLGLLLLGSGLLDGAYYADTTFGLMAPHAVRAVVIDPVYAIAGVLLAGSAWRIRSLILPLPPGNPDEV